MDTQITKNRWKELTKLSNGLVIFYTLRSAASMPSSQNLYLMMFVGKYSCTSHVLQYSSSLSYEHSRSLQSILCPEVVTVLICSFFVAALLLIYINLKNGGKIIHIFTNHQTFSYLFCIFNQKCSSKS